MSLRNFLGRYDALMSVLGAIIVVGTYFVKDVFRDEAEKVADEISQAENIFNVRSDLRVANGRLDTIERVVRGVSVKVWGEKAKSGRLSMTYDPTAEYSKQIYEQSSITLDAVSRLVESVPEKSNIVERMNTLKGELVLLHNVNDDVDEIGSKMRIGGTKEEIETLRQQARDEARKLEEAQGQHPLQLAVADLWSEALPLAEEQQTRYKARAERWKYVSIVLFCIASALALVGKLFGPKKEEPEMEATG